MLFRSTSIHETRHEKEGQNRDDALKVVHVATLGTVEKHPLVKGQLMGENTRSIVRITAIRNVILQLREILLKEGLVEQRATKGSSGKTSEEKVEADQNSTEQDPRITLRETE